jgi:beta-lactamase superfamily II metal-dependent hydrolase
MASVNRLHILDVGHGNSAILIDESEVVVIDAGPNNTLLQFLLQESITKVGVVLISHADSDHIKGLIALITAELVEISNIFLNSDSQKGTVLWDDLLYALNYSQKTNKIHTTLALHAGMNVAPNCTNVEVEVLAPSVYLAGKGPGGTDNYGNILNANTVSAVIRLVHNGIPIALLPGDIDEVGLIHLLQSTAQPHALIAVFPHHGGLPGATTTPQKFARAFAEAVNPEVLLFSMGRGGRFDNPRPEIVSAIIESLPTVHIACTQLSKRCSDTTTLNTDHLTDYYSSGRSKGFCCAGSLHIDLVTNNTIHPLSAHKHFVDTELATPMCNRVINKRIDSIDIIS